jgi:hypothetical protein
MNDFPPDTSDFSFIIALDPRRLALYGFRRLFSGFSKTKKPFK